MNSQTFTPAEVKSGLLNDFVDCLLRMNLKMESRFNEIHITSDGYCTIVEYDSVPYDRESGGRFEYVDENYRVMKEVLLPDRTLEYAGSDEEEKDIIDDFLKNHPEYYMSEYGHWVNKNEEQEFRESLGLPTYD